MIKLYWQKIGFHWLWKVRKCGKFQKTNLLNSLWLHEKGPGVTSRCLHTFPALGSRSIFPAFHLLHATPCKEQLLDFPHLGLVSFVLGTLVGTNFSLACLRFSQSVQRQSSTQTPNIVKYCNNLNIQTANFIHLIFRKLFLGYLPLDLALQRRL